MLMAAIDPANAGEYNANAANFFNLYLQQTIPYTPGGLAYPYHWGALRPTTQVGRADASTLSARFECS